MKYTNSINGTALNIISLHKFVTCLVYWCVVIINVYQYFIMLFVLYFVIAITLYICIYIYIYIRRRKKLLNDLKISQDAGKIPTFVR